MPLGTGHKTCGGMIEPATTPAVPPAAMSGAVGFAPLEFLITLLINISRMDSDGFFDEPVREEDAPGYYNVIKQPMCFQRMKEKLRGREYRTWRGLVADFELICSNAMTYNQKRSRVHKSALSMLRAGKKQLQAAELEGRKAIALLHPEGPSAAAADEAREAAEAEAAAAAAARHPARVAKMALRQGSIMSDAPSGTPRTGGAKPPRMGFGAALGIPPAETPSCTDADDFQFDMHSDRDEGYSSFSGSDEEDGETAPAVSSFWLPHMDSIVEVQPWPQQPSGRRENSSKRSSAWKHRRRKTEWKARWLELRLQELQHQQTRYGEQLAALRQRTAAEASTPAEASRGPASPLDVPSSALLEAGTQLENNTPADASEPRLGDTGEEQPGSIVPLAAATPKGAAGRQNSAGDFDRDGLSVRHRRRHDRQQARELAAPHLLEHPFFAALAGVRNPKQVMVDMSQPELEVERETFPACTYAALEFCQRHLAAVKNQLVQQPGQRQRPQKRVAPPPKGRMRGGAAMGTRGMPTRQRSMLGLAAKPSLERCASAKRRRNDYDVSDMIMPHMSGGAPKFVERVQVAEINVPEVRLLPEAEIMQREAAVAAFRCNLKSQGQVQMPDELQDVLRGQPGEGSSSEDTSDEAYMTRHQPKEEEERQRFLGIPGGGAQKRNLDDKTKGHRPQNGKLLREKSFSAVDSAVKDSVKTPTGQPPLPSPAQQEAGTPASVALRSSAAETPDQPGQIAENVSFAPHIQQQFAAATPQAGQAVLQLLTPVHVPTPMEIDGAPTAQQQKGSGGALRRGRPPGSKTRRKLSNGKASRGRSRGRGRGGRGGGGCIGNGLAEHSPEHADTAMPSPAAENDDTPESSIDVAGDAEDSTEVVITGSPAEVTG